jgi:hypothetical protein
MITRAERCLLPWGDAACVPEQGRDPRAAYRSGDNRRSSRFQAGLENHRGVVIVNAFDIASSYRGPMMPGPGQQLSGGNALVA